MKLSPSKPVYRYLSPRHADALMATGAIRIGSLQSFRGLEDKLGDRLDGGVAFRPPPDGVVLGDHPMLRHLGIALEDGQRVRIVDGSFQKHFTGHALCLCVRPDNSHLLAMRPAVVEITDRTAFAVELGNACDDRLGPRTLGGLVRYEEREWSDIDLARPPDPFIKRPEFQKEEEYRLFWPDTQGTEPIDIIAPALTQFLRRIR